MKGKSFITLNEKKLNVSFDVGALEDYCEDLGIEMDQVEPSLQNLKNIRIFLYHSIEPELKKDIKKEDLRKLHLSELRVMHNLIHEADSGNVLTGKRATKQV